MNIWSAGNSRPAMLKGRRVLIVEDEVIVAFSMECEILDAGGVVVGPAYTLAEALDLIDDRLDVALLDINIMGEKIWPVADLLLARGVPFLFASANCREPDAIGAPYAHVPCLDKPVVMTQLVSTLAELAAARDQERLAS